MEAVFALAAAVGIILAGDLALLGHLFGRPTKE